MCSSAHGELFIGRTVMNAQIAGRQILQWVLRNATSPVLNPTVRGRCHVSQHLSTSYRLLCSSSNQPSPQALQHNNEASQSPRQPVGELSLQSLLDMGFTDMQADHVYETVTKARGGRAAEHALSTLAALFALGLNASSVLKVLEKCPELYHVKGSQVQQRIGNLRKQGLVEGSLQRVVSHYPQILTMTLKRINSVVLFLREKCLFTTQQITDILRDSPAVVQEDLDQLEYKFQYVYFRMGVKQAEITKSKLFRVSLDEVRCRHCFLERRGLYQTPDKKGQTLILNPKLDDILSVDQHTYLTDVAKATVEEYEVFQRLVAREWQEEEEQQGDLKDDRDSDDKEDSDEEEEEEELLRKKGYMKRRKR